MRERTHCGNGHTGDDLYVRPNGQRACRACQRVFSRRYREKNLEATRTRARDYARQRWAREPEVMVENARRWRSKNRARSQELNRRYLHRKLAFIYEVLGTACVDCGDDRPGAVQYHHPDGRGDDRSLTARSWAEIKDEIMKVIPLCGACHGVRHHKKEEVACVQK